MESPFPQLYAFSVLQRYGNNDIVRLYSILCRLCTHNFAAKLLFISTRSRAKNGRFCRLSPHKIAASSKRRHMLAVSYEWLRYEKGCSHSLFLGTDAPSSHHRGVVVCQGAVSTRGGGCPLRGADAVLTAWGAGQV